jgi:hypothetical protein
MLLGVFTYAFSTAENGQSAYLSTQAVTYTGGGAGKYAHMWRTDDTPQRENAGEKIGAGPAVALVVQVGGERMMPGGAADNSDVPAAANTEVGEADPNAAATWAAVQIVSGDTATEAGAIATTDQAAINDAAIVTINAAPALLDPSWLAVFEQAIQHARSSERDAAASMTVDEVLARYGI